MIKYPRVAIIYLSFHCEPYIEAVASALEKITYPKDRVELVIVDNPHPEFGSSFRFLEEKIMPLSGNRLPRVTLIANEQNLGFAGGNNVGVKYALDNGFDYVFLHNNDAFVAPNFLDPLVEAMEKDKQIGAAQSLLMLYPEKEMVNSAGNVLHYLGFAYCWGYRRKITDLSLPAIKEIDYASGAALLLRADLLKKYGGLDEDFFLYHEDLEYCYRLKCLGYKIVLVRDSLVYHQYEFKRSISKYFWLERNRYAMMLMFFKWKTLFLLAPMGLLAELGLLIMSWRSGWFGERMKMYRYWLKRENWRLWLVKRRRIQGLRKISDKELLKGAVSEILFQEEEVASPVLKYLGNPVMRGYWRLTKHLIFW